MPQPDELARLRDLQTRCEADFRAIATQYPELCTAVAHRRFDGYICQQYATKGGYMPSKGYRTMGEELENVAMRLPMSVLAQVDAHIDTLRKTAPWAKVGRSDALRDLVVRGLASLSQPQPAQVPLTTQPAIPLTLEGVPASERTQPPTPAPTAEPMPETTQTSYVPPGMQRCLNTRLKHPPYASSEKECPMCANNRRQREHYARNKEQQASS
jgi:hypothetical protein